MASKIGKKEWWLVYAVAGTIDAIEFFTDLFLTEFFAIPEAVWLVADRIIGVVLIAYFELRGVRILTNTSRLLSMVGVQGVEFITGGGAPAWIIDVWYIHKTVRAEEAAIQAQIEQDELVKNVSVQPLYQDGVRRPDKPPVIDGPAYKQLNGKTYRLPKKGS